MGTNYYWCVNHCLHCNRNEKVHIGKLSGGWQFSFHSYPGGVYDKDDQNLLAPQVVSWEDWKKVIVRAPEDRNDPLYKVPWGHIEDEYGKVIGPDEFEEMVEATRGELNHFDETRGSQWAYAIKDHKDADGWSMTPCNFS